MIQLRKQCGNYNTLHRAINSSSFDKTLWEFENIKQKHAFDLQNVGVKVTVLRCPVGLEPKNLKKDDYHLYQAETDWQSCLCHYHCFLGCPAMFVFHSFVVVCQIVTVTALLVVICQLVIVIAYQCCSDEHPSFQGQQGHWVRCKLD